jgi:ParB family chromosome partitioning protein
MSIQQQTTTIELSAILPPQSNPRSRFDESGIAGLAESIAQDGLLQNLVVAKGRGKQFRIISGERRFRALKLLAERGTIGGDFAVPVEVRGKLSKDDKLRLATVENVQRIDLPPLDEAAAFAALIKKGTALADLAAKTGLSATTIRRRFVLNDLCGEAKEALRDERISLAQAEALTLGNEAQQQRALEEIESGRYEFTANDVREFMLDDRPSVSMAIFPIERYQGTLTTDLFAQAQTSYFDDVEQFMALQREAVETLAEAYRAKAAWVEITENYSLSAWSYREAEEGEDPGVIINLAPSGRVEIREGLVSRDLDTATAAALSAHPSAPKKEKPVYSAPLCRLIAWHKSAAIAELLLSDARKAREVGVTDRLYRFTPHQAVRQLSAQEETGMAIDVLDMQARLCAEWLGFTLDDEQSIWAQFPPQDLDERDLYEAVRALSDHQLEKLDTLLTALSFGQKFCERLDTQDSLFNRVARDLKADMRNHWKVDRTFLEKRTRDQLLEIATECGCADLYGIGTLRTFKKGELIGSLLRHFTLAYSAAEPNAAQEKARGWLPDAMLFPAIDPQANVVADDEDAQDCAEAA